MSNSPTYVLDDDGYYVPNFLPGCDRVIPAMRTVRVHGANEAQSRARNSSQSDAASARGDADRVLTFDLEWKKSSLATFEGLSAAPSFSLP
jgi:hypothetical protein